MKILCILEIAATVGKNLGIGTKSLVGDIIYSVYILWLEEVLVVEVLVVEAVSAELVYTVYLEP